VPDRLTVAALGLTLLECAIVLPGCSSSPSSPSSSSPALTEITTTSHYVIHSSPGDIVNTAWQEVYYEWLVLALQLQPSPRLDYYKYRDVRTSSR
jgi:hypothetical protein